MTVPQDDIPKEYIKFVKFALICDNSWINIKNGDQIWIKNIQTDGNLLTLA